LKRANVSRRFRVAGTPPREGRRRLVLLALLVLLAAGLWVRIPLRRLWLERQSLTALADYVTAHAGETDAALLLAKRALAVHDAAQAEMVSRQLIDRDPGNPHAWLMRSQAEFEQGKLAASYASLQVAMPFLDRSAEAHWRMGLLRERRGEETLAEQEFLRALERDGRHAGAHLELARSALAHRHYGPARQHLEIVVRDDPANLAALEALSLTYRYLGKLDAAEKLARDAVHRAPRSGRAWRALAQALRDRATEPALREAEQAYHQALTITPDSSELHHELGMIYFRWGDYPRAAAELQAAIDLYPLNRQPYPTLIQCYRRLGQGDRADRLSVEFRKIDEMDLSTAPLEYSIYAMPENTALRMQLARLYVRYKRPDLALDQIERVLELNPNHAEAQRLRDKLKAGKAGS
jgi:tetratricopeptide (TPR) repeat protein